MKDFISSTSSFLSTLAEPIFWPIWILYVTPMLIFIISGAFARQHPQGNQRVWQFMQKPVVLAYLLFITSVFLTSPLTKLYEEGFRVWTRWWNQTSCLVARLDTSKADCMASSEFVLHIILMIVLLFAFGFLTKLAQTKINEWSTRRMAINERGGTNSSALVCVLSAVDDREGGNFTNDRIASIKQGICENAADIPFGLFKNGSPNAEEAPTLKDFCEMGNSQKPELGTNRQKAPPTEWNWQVVLQNMAEMLYTGANWEEAKLTKNAWKNRTLKRVHLITPQIHESLDFKIGETPAANVMAEIANTLLDNELLKLNSGQTTNCEENSGAKGPEENNETSEINNKELSLPETILAIDGPETLRDLDKDKKSKAIFICWNEGINIDDSEAIYRRMQDIIEFEKEFGERNPVQFDVTSGHALYSALVAVETRRKGVVFSYIDKIKRDKDERSVIAYDVSLN